MSDISLRLPSGNSCDVGAYSEPDQADALRVVVEVVHQEVQEVGDGLAHLRGRAAVAPVDGDHVHVVRRQFRWMMKKRRRE